MVTHFIAACLNGSVSASGLKEKAEEADWQPAKTKDGVQVFTGLVPGSKFLAFKATTVIKAPVKAVLAAVTDHAAYPQWYDNCKSTEIIEWREPATALVHIVIKTPFPLSNRDAINQVTVIETPDETRVELTSLPEHIDHVRGLVRMETASGSWQLQPVAEGTRVIHTYHADPRARVPAWMVNRFVVDGPINSLTKLRGRLEN